MEKELNKAELKNWMLKANKKRNNR
jgi:hypothetical protein